MEYTVHIITGPIGSGKTTRLSQLYRDIGSGDGFVLLKQFSGGNYIGQRIERIDGSFGVDFSRLISHIPIGWDEAERYGNYSFSYAGFCFAGQIIHEALREGVATFYIDEIGPLELRQCGFYSLVHEVLREEKGTYMTVRDSCMEKVINLFQIREPVIL